MYIYIYIYIIYTYIYIYIYIYRVEIALESDPPKSRFSIRRLAVQRRVKQIRTNKRKERKYMYRYMCVCI